MKTPLTPHPRAAAAGAAVLAAALLTAGCGSGAHHRTIRPAAAATASTTTAAVAAQPPAARQGTTVFAVAHAPRARRSTAPRIPAGRVLRTFTGHGAGALGSLSQRSAVVIEWHAATAPVQLLAGPGFLLLDSRSRTGRITLARGSYPHLRIGTPGAWTVQLRAVR